MTHKRSRSNISTIGDEKRPSTCSPWGRDRWPVGLFFFEALAFESHQFIKMTGCISKMSPVAEKNWLFDKTCFSNFFSVKKLINMWKLHTFVRSFLCCIFHQHILVRPTGFEPAVFRVGVIRPSSRKALQGKGLVEIAQISAILKKNLRSLAGQGFWDFLR